jgi:hypothetical protein
MKATLTSRFLLVFCVLFLLSAACTMPMYNQTQEAPNTAQTLAVQTINAMMTEISGSSTTATPGSSNQPDGNPTTAAEPTLRPSSTPLPTATQIIIPTATATPVCDMAAFMSDVTIPDGSNVLAGSEFVKTWRIRNEGACTWSSDYAAVFDSGEAMGAPASQALGVSVAPGQTVDLSVKFTAPTSGGEHRSNWKLRNAKGVLFGLGGNGTGKFYVVIKVTAATLSGNGLNFATNVCSAVWTGNDNSLPCNGTDGNSAGFVLYKPAPLLESGYQDDEPAIITNPPAKTDGVIRGKYPAYTVKDKDHFTAILGCEYKATKCNVRFQLDYQIDNSGITTIGAWNEAYEGKYTQVDVDLSSLAGKKVNFILTVMANGESNGDRAMWFMPQIQNEP